MPPNNGVRRARRGTLIDREPTEQEGREIKGREMTDLEPLIINRRRQKGRVKR